MTTRGIFRDHPSLTAAEFRLLRDHMNQHAGLFFEEDSLYMFERRLAERLDDLGFSSFSEYYKHLRHHPSGFEELEAALELITTKETYFFRQEYQLTAFQREILPELAVSLASQKRLRVWSAGCSTGEEVYTLAMLIEQTELFKDWSVRVVGTDLSKKSVAHARRGLYRESSLRVTTPQQRAVFFDERPSTGVRMWEVKERIKRNSWFGNLNLLDPAKASMVGRVDVVFCRNVLIYFDTDSRRRVIDALYERLVPGGYLLLGHSESLLNLSTAFELVHLTDDLVYRKPLAAQRWDR
ncbi:MAG: protein-glutamate O-methyltransferase CheR [Polyangiaceae bacterium]|nr:protein-glutamate O-methyltransferase CheR [Polyangiaceae bacterium]